MITILIMKKLLLVLVLLALIVSVDARVPKVGDYIKLTTIYGNSRWGIVINPDTLMSVFGPPEHCLEINATRDCGSAACSDNNPPIHAYMPWKIISNVTWPNSTTLIDLPFLFPRNPGGGPIRPPIENLRLEIQDKK